MGKDIGKNIYDEGIDYSYIALISKKLRIGVIGGGKAGAIKTKHFVNNKCYVEVLSKTFDNEIIELSKSQHERLKLIKEDFSYEFLKDKHLIIVALNDLEINIKVKEYCNENYKIYIDSSNFMEGMGSVPVERRTENISFALNTKYGNPKGAVLISEKVKNLLNEYDEFIKYTSIIRNRAKLFPEYKGQITAVIGNDDFKKVFDEGKGESLLRSNFPKEIVDYLLNF